MGIDSEHGRHSSRDVDYGRGSHTRLGEDCTLGEGHGGRNRPWEEGRGVVQESAIGHAHEEACPAESAASSQFTVRTVGWGYLVIRRQHTGLAVP